MKKHHIIICLLLGNMIACVDINPNQKTQSEIQQENIVSPEALKSLYPYEHSAYVPIYSDIYNKTKNLRVNLTATLSIRNTSLKDTLYVKEVDYYNTEGKLVREYLNSSIFLRPLETIDYVIEQEDVAGGSGANFIINWGAQNDLKPIFQAVMVGTIGQHAFSFTTNGVTVN